MFSLIISLYEFGQFLYILLWIFVPAFMILLLTTTYLQYRSKRQPVVGVFAIPRGYTFANYQGEEQAQSGEEWPDMHSASTNSGQAADEEAPWNEDSRERIYRGILFMKEKFERYREEADRRYEHVKEELTKSEKKYNDLLNSPSALAGDLVEEKNKQITYLQSQLDLRIESYHEMERRMSELAHTIEVEQARSEELIGKLQDNTRLLMNIYGELDRSLVRGQVSQGQAPSDQKETSPDHAENPSEGL